MKKSDGSIVTNTIFLVDFYSDNKELFESNYIRFKTIKVSNKQSIAY